MRGQGLDQRAVITPNPDEPINERDRAILHALADGKPRKEIANELHMSPANVVYRVGTLPSPRTGFSGPSSRVIAVWLLSISIFVICYWLEHSGRHGDVFVA